MPYLYERFGATYAGGEALPQLDGSEPQGAGEFPGSMVELPGGKAWDWLGSDRAVSRSQVITITGDWVAASVAAMETKIDNLNALFGVRSYLWRSNDGGTTTRKRLARCIGVRVPIEMQSALVATIELDFELAPGLWQGTAHSETTIIDAASHAVATTNNGNATVRDAIITVTAKVAAITAVSFYINGILHWHYSGTIGINKALVVNCDTKTVTNDGVDAYVNFALQADHPSADWNPLAAGLNTITVETTSTDHTAHEVKLEYADGWI